MFDQIIHGGTVVFSDHCRVADLGITNGKIACIADSLPANLGKEVVNAAGQYVLPGMIDVHMHVSEPGRTEWEGYETATKALAAGGATAFVEMPLNTLPATIDVASLDLKMAEAKTKSYVDYAPMGGLVPWNLGELEALSKAGVAAFKCFVATCGSSEPNDFKNIDDFTLFRGMQILAKTGDLLFVHCENAAITDALGKEAKESGKTKVSDYVATRPVITEEEAVRRVLLFARDTGCRVHIAHCSAPEAILPVIEAMQNGVDASFESCPHYFLLATEELDAIGNTAKCSPPIRNFDNQNRLWELFAKGQIQMLASDHSPCTFDMKAFDNAFNAWGGISGCQNSVDTMFDAAFLQRGLCPSLLAKAFAENPAKRFGLPNKGTIALGKDADLVLIDPRLSYTLKAEDLYYKNKMSAYVGRKINCRITHTFLRGKLVYSLEKGILGKAEGLRLMVNK